MNRICIDTDQIKKIADAVESAAGTFTEAGDRILRTASGLPGYGSQLSTPANATGCACQGMCRSLCRDLQGAAQSLRETAQAFEAVDDRMVAAFDGARRLLVRNPFLAAGGKPRGWAMPIPAVDPLPPPDMTPEEPVGSVNFGYAKVGTRFVYLFYQGKTIIVDLQAVDIETAAQIEAFLQAVDEWESVLSEFCGEDVDQIIAVLQEFFFGAGALASVPVTSVFGAIVAGGAWAKTFVDAGKWTEDFEEDWNALWEWRSKAAGIFSWLETAGKDGVLSRPTTPEESNLFER
jgi:hypothetical protein